MNSAEQHKIYDTKTQMNIFHQNAVCMTANFESFWWLKIIQLVNQVIVFEREVQLLAFKYLVFPPNK